MPRQWRLLAAIALNRCRCRQIWAALREARGHIVTANAKYHFLNPIHMDVGSQGCHMDVLVAGARTAFGLADSVNAQVPGSVNNAAPDPDQYWRRAAGLFLVRSRRHVVRGLWKLKCLACLSTAS